MKIGLDYLLYCWNVALVSWSIQIAFWCIQIIYEFNYALKINQAKREAVGGIYVFPCYLWSRIILIFLYLKKGIEFCIE